jgi:ribosomal protein S18 acetylase RimI-like enzyme
LPLHLQCAAARRVSLHVAVGNVAAVSLYKRLGFAAVRKLVAYFREVGGETDAWEMGVQPAVAAAVAVRWNAQLFKYLW